MEAMAQEWTEGRLDELSGKVDQGFKKTDADVRALGTEMRTEFASVRNEMKEMRGELRDEIQGLRGEMNEGARGLRAEMERVNGRIDSVQRAIFFGAIAMTSAILAGFAAICTLLAATL